MTQIHDHTYITYMTMAERKDDEEDLLNQLMIFTSNDTINVVAYMAMSVGKPRNCWEVMTEMMSSVGMFVNGMILVVGGRKVQQLDTRSRTNVHYLVYQLTLADSIVCFITLPLEAAWRFTIQWRAGNVACKVLMVVRALGYYLSSAIMVAICIDR